MSATSCDIEASFSYRIIINFSEVDKDAI